MRHLLGLTFEESAAATDEYGVSCKKTLRNIRGFLIASKFNLVVTILSLDFAKVNDVSPCVARCMQAGNFDVSDVKNLFVFDFKRHARDTIMLSTHYIYSK